MKLIFKREVEIMWITKVQEGRKELVLFDINKTYYRIKLCRETPTKAQPVSLSQEPPRCHDT